MLDLFGRGKIKKLCQELDKSSQLNQRLVWANNRLEKKLSFLERRVKKLTKEKTAWQKGVRDE